MVARVLNILMYLVSVLLLGGLVAIAIAYSLNYRILDVLFWLGIFIAVVGAMSGIRGNPTGSRVFSGTTDSQYQSYVNIEALQMERDATNYTKTFTKHGVFDPKLGSIGAILAGVVFFLISYVLS